MKRFGIVHFLHSCWIHSKFHPSDHRRKSITWIRGCAVQIFLWKFSLRLEKRFRGTQHISEENRWLDEENWGASAWNAGFCWRSPRLVLWPHERIRRFTGSIAFSKYKTIRLWRDLLSSSFLFCQLPFRQINSFTIGFKTKVSHKLHVSRKPRYRKIISSPPSSPQCRRRNWRLVCWSRKFATLAKPRRWPRTSGLELRRK